LIGAGIVYDTITDNYTKTLADIFGDYTLKSVIKAAYETPDPTDTIPGLNGTPV